MVNLPEPATAQKDPKFTVETPEAKVTSISATQKDKHEFIKFLVAEIKRLKVEQSLASTTNVTTAEPSLVSGANNYDFDQY